MKSHSCFPVLRTRRSLLQLSLAALLSATSLSALPALAADSTDARTLEIVAPWEINGLHPSTSGFVFQRMQVVETLVEVDHQGALIGGLASSWQVSDDGLRWQFNLRKGARFHDGTPVTASAMLRSLAAARIDPAMLSAAPIERIEARDPHELVIVLKQRYGALPALLAHSSTAILAPASFTDDGKVKAIIASGPYRIESVTPPQQMTVKRFEQYDGTQPAIGRAHYLAAGRAETRALMAESGQADLAFTLDPASLQRIRSKGVLGIDSVTLPRTTILKLNAGLKGLDDVRVRQALSLAINRAGIAKALLRDPEMAASQLFPPSMPEWFDKSLPALGFDLDKARQLLADAGWKQDDRKVLRNAEGEALTLTIRTFPDRPELPQIATALQAQWGELGIAVKVNIGNSGDIPLGHRDGSLQVGLSARNYGTVPDPIGALAQDFSPKGGDWGAMNWHDASLDVRIASLSAGTLTDDETRAARHAISRILQEQLPVIPVSWYRQQVVVGKRVQGVSVDPLERSYRLTEMQWRP